MSKSLDRLALLATYARIAERGSISAAARDLGLSQASASRQLHALEQRLGTTLIHRTTHSLALTEAGQKALAEARILLQGWDALVETLVEDERRLTGTLKIVAPLALGQQYLTQAMLAFQRTHPDLNVTWVLQDTPLRFAEVGCDLWIKIGSPADETLIVEEIATAERLFTAAPSLLEAKRPHQPAQLEQLPCIALSDFEGTMLKLIHKKGQQVTLQTKAVFSTNNILSAYAAVKGAMGYAVMPRWLIAKDLKSGALVDILPSWRAPALSITASFLPAARQTRRLRVVKDHLSAAIRKIISTTAAP